MLIDKFIVSKIEEMFMTDWILVHTTSRCRTNKSFVVLKTEFPFAEGDTVIKVFVKGRRAKYFEDINMFDDGLIQLKALDIKLLLE